MQIIDIWMPPRSSKTTALVAMLKGFNQHELCAMYVGSDEQCVEIVRQHGIPREWTFRFGLLVGAEISKIPKILIIDDREYTESKFKKIFGFSLLDTVRNIEAHGHVYVFNLYPPLHEITIEQTINLSSNDIKLIEKSLGEASRSIAEVNQRLYKK
ncbi:hypothetical protein U2T19_004723 [Salmonella enterica]|nr:hypothetical protein [Salmonella enterica]